MALDQVNSTSNSPPEPLLPRPSHTMKKTRTVEAVEKVLVYIYATFNWSMFVLLGLVRGGFKQPEEQHFLKIAVAQDQFWNLSKQPIPGFDHAFFELGTGEKLHYIHNRGQIKSSSASDLLVFIHGFPDSAMMWRSLLKEPALPKDSATIICVDMPGYGGSDSFDTYDCRVLDALTEFIVAMREEYTKSDETAVRKTYVVGHDWGCAITLRLAADAPGLADRFLTTNGPLIDHARANAYSRLGSAAKIFKQFRSAPTKNIGLLSKSFQVIKPVLYQVWLSGYITVFQLPKPFLTYLGSAGNMFFPRAIAEMEHGREAGTPNIPECIGALRPGPLECATTLSGTKETYGSSVLSRAESPGLAFWHMTAYYRDGLSWQTWEKSLETVTFLYNIENEPSSPDSGAKRRSSSASSALFTEQYRGSLRAPLTMLWGGEDIALSKTMCIDGLGDYLAKESEVILLPRSGHWTALEKESRNVWLKIINTLLRRSQTSNGAGAKQSRAVGYSVLDEVKEVYPGATLIVKR